MKLRATAIKIKAIIAMILIIIFSSYALMVVSKRVERAVLVQSHQYQEGMAERVAIMQASLAEIDARLVGTLDASIRSDLKAQQATIRVQLAAARR